MACAVGKYLAGAALAALASAPAASAQSTQDDVSVSVTVDAGQPYLSFKTMTDPALSLTAGEFSISPSETIGFYGGGCLHTNFDALDITITHDNPYPEYATQGWRYFMSDPAKQTHLSYHFAPSFWGELGADGISTGGGSAPDSTGAPFTWQFNNRETGLNLRQTDADCTGLHSDFSSRDFGPGNFFYTAVLSTEISGSTPAGWPDDAYPDLKSLIEALGPGDFTFTDTITLTFSPPLGS